MSDVFVPEVTVRPPIAVRGFGEIIDLEHQWLVKVSKPDGFHVCGAGPTFAEAFVNVADIMAWKQESDDASRRIAESAESLKPLLVELLRAFIDSLPPGTRVNIKTAKGAR